MYQNLCVCVLLWPFHVRCVIGQWDLSNCPCLRLSSAVWAYMHMRNCFKQTHTTQRRGKKKRGTYIQRGFFVVNRLFKANTRQSLLLCFPFVLSRTLPEKGWIIYCKSKERCKHWWRKCSIDERLTQSKKMTKMNLCCENNIA